MQILSLCILGYSVLSVTQKRFFIISIFQVRRLRLRLSDVAKIIEQVKQFDTI